MTTRSAVRAGRLSAAHAAALARLLDRDPVVNVYLRSELQMGIENGDWWGVVDGDSVRATALGRPLIVPCIPNLEDAQALAETVAATVAPHMLVGPRDAVLAFHRALHRPAREVRDPQYLLAVDRSGFTRQESSPVRPARRSDIDALVVAAADMHREEMGIDPLAIDAAGWRARMANLVDRGWSWVWTERGMIIFKAELSAWTHNAVQIQGVWTHPAYRSRGIGRIGLAAVCASLLSEVAMCTLYVNHYNRAALALYERLGFRKVADFATVIY
jgi:ribosomal protein S18 acetylase RimI-like enzyme